MKCAICKRPGIWNQRFSVVLYLDHFRKKEIGTLREFIEIAQISGVTEEPVDRILRILLEEDKE